MEPLRVGRLRGRLSRHTAPYSLGLLRNSAGVAFISIFFRELAVTTINLNIGLKLTLYQGIAYFIQWLIVGAAVGLIYRPWKTVASNRPRVRDEQPARCRVAATLLKMPFERSRWRGGRCACDTAKIMGCQEHRESGTGLFPITP